ncbi:hypothetical protein [Dokdonia sp.]|uniref:hypothetical protein n=1 Tax=Dokdonia sp. TaxID=2024995 RepID=UPI0032641FBD
MKKYLIICLVLCTTSLLAQRDWSGPKGNEPLPEKLQNVRRAIDVINFPKENDPIKIGDRYYWKHLTSILCKESPVEIIDYGAYLFYDGTWNLRKSYPLKELDKTFGSKKQQLLQGTPYSWTDNQRIGKNLYGGWALWYFIGITEDGETICGYDTINTTTHLLNN